ncbi:Histidine kinase [Nonomuraea solani]|uniref:histidine kinase n=1 Tax=Nonomuraea solani TaxID=1144553 RepID=A0A1H6DKY9_9ACTN|nr:sensor histidine kinase [Nonomuraea solani]SEG85878.1 Histidine kinase [Nonomuraea solani]
MGALATEHTRRSGRLRRPRAALSRLSRLGDVPVVVMLAWAGWLAVPWSFNGLAQARAAAAAAADAEPPQATLPAAHHHPPRTAAAWSLPPTHATPYPTLRPTPTEHPATRHDRPDALTAWPGEAATGVTGPNQAEATTTSPGTTDTVTTWPPETPTTDTTAGRPREADTGAVWPGRAEVVAVERARIAGEVHDAAGHGLAAIALQAGIALVTLDDDPEQARASLRAIKETSTTALQQLRAALDGIDPPGGDLPRLIDGVRAAGLPVDVEPAEPAVPDHLQGTVYRVVRESLTNVLRHAGPTRALVRVSGDPREFVLEVADRGAGWTGATEGRGLTGMRAKVTEAGGHFTAGPREGGGFQVIAKFPQAST